MNNRTPNFNIVSEKRSAQPGPSYRGQDLETVFWSAVRSVASDPRDEAIKELEAMPREVFDMEYIDTTRALMEAILDGNRADLVNAVINTNPDVFFRGRHRNPGSDAKCRRNENIIDMALGRAVNTGKIGLALALYKCGARPRGDDMSGRSLIDSRLGNLKFLLKETDDKDFVHLDDRDTFVEALIQGTVPKIRSQY